MKMEKKLQLDGVRAIMTLVKYRFFDPWIYKTQVVNL